MRPPLAAARSADLSDELVTRYRDLVAGVESLTVVYDAGQSSGDNHAVVEAHGIGFVGSLPPGDHPDLLAIPARDYRPVDTDRYPGLRYLDTTVTALGVTRRAVLTHSQTLHAKQSGGLDQTLAKARRRLAELQARLARGATRRDRAAIQAQIAAICKPRWVAEIITVTLTGDKPAELRLSWRSDARARARLEARLFGKRILFTNRDWPVGEVVAAYRSQSDAEFGFRQLKDPHVVSFSPDAPLDRRQDPGARVLLRARPRHRPPDAPPRRPGRPAHVRPRAARPARRHRRNRAALPRRRQGSPTGCAACSPR